MAYLLNIMLVIIGSCMVAAGPAKPSICATVKCMAPPCTNPITPPGKCCPICPEATEKPGACPELTGFGICIEGCTNDGSCPTNQKCCSNGCGHTCQTPVGEKDCSQEVCSMVYCDGQFTPLGQCCPICPE